MAISKEKKSGSIATYLPIPFPIAIGEHISNINDRASWAEKKQGEIIPQAQVRFLLPQANRQEANSPDFKHVLKEPVDIYLF